jgi:hypothetical protein
MEQLQRLLESHAFRNSQRYPGFLRYVVVQTLAGQGEYLKERTLGIAVFHRQPDYDTNADPVVRVTAGEVRKRLAQYYQEHPSELRIELSLGSYIAHFQPAPRVGALGSAPAPEAAEESDAPSEAPQGASRTHTFAQVPYLVVVAAFLLGAGLLASLFMAHDRPQSVLQRFWAPLVLAHQSPAFIIGGRVSVYLAGDGTPLPQLGLAAPAPTAAPGSTPADPPERVTTISVGDAFAFARVASLLTREGYNYSAASAVQTSLEDLRAHPSVLFGGFNNSWTLHATSQLRYRLGYDKPPGYSHMVWIVDSKNPAKRWAINCQQSLLDATHDYAIVARYFDTDIEQQVVIVAGLRENGTTAASEFLTNPRYLAQLDAFAPRDGWAKHNLEAVIQTEVVGGRSGPPHVVAAYFW